MRLKNVLLSIAVPLLMLMSTISHAVLTIEIDEGYDNATPIAVVPFQQPNTLSAEQDIANVIASNLRRSGYFKPVSEKKFPEQPFEVEQINFAKWHSVDTDYLIIGQVSEQSSDRYQIDIAFVDRLRKKVMLNKRWKNIRGSQLRKVGHIMSDAIYQEILGIQGAFNTQIAYVTVQKENKKKVYTLEIADADGFNSQTILRSYEPIMSPAWSPDGRNLAYVSFENGRSEIFIQSIYGSFRKKLPAFKGINSAPSWSPDGTKLSMTLSKGGNPNLYIMDLKTGKFEQVTSDRAIETESDWSPDGQTLYFNSDRRGQPQIFAIDLKTKQTKRITFEGGYNSNPDLSADGKFMSILHNNGSGLNIAIYEFETGDVYTISDTFLDESPSFSPNGEMVLYAMNRGGRGQLAVVSKDGKASQVLKVKNAEVREPAWGPYVK
jgi:TolB protein